MIAYKLNQNIDGSKLLNDIQNMINKFAKSNPDKESLLIIDIKPIITDDSSFIPKLEYKTLD